MEDWHYLALNLYKQGWSYQDIQQAIFNKFGFIKKTEAIRSCIRRHKNDGEQLSFFDNTTETTTDIPKKQEIVQNLEPSMHAAMWKGAKHISFALIGDTQMGSKYTQITHLKTFYDICKSCGIADVYHTGDITDGIKMRPGHEYELYKISADEMRDDVVKNYPMIEGLTTHFITGNHDASLYKHVGFDIGAAIAEKRPDLDYLGRDCAIVCLTPNCKMELRHPWDGTAYAISYKTQKMVEAMDNDVKPDILAVGHYHKAEYMYHRGVHIVQTGCFQSQTPFTRGKGIAVSMGGWIINLVVDEDGNILSFGSTFVPFATPIKDDYKQYV